MQTSERPTPLSLSRHRRGVPLPNHRARELRREQTAQERLIWKHLRDRRLNGLRFRRQVPIGDFIADFCCREKMLILELDGSQHAEQVAYDSWRTQMLEQRGYRVLRFWNKEVAANMSGVLETILIATRCTSP